MMPLLFLNNVSHNDTQVIGVEVCKPAVEDAIINAKLNNIANTEFVCAKAEDALPKLFRRPQFSSSNNDNNDDSSSSGNIVCIVDPPREGLHGNCSRAIRGCSHITKLVYVSCNPTKTMPKDLLVLCGAESKKQRYVIHYVGIYHLLKQLQIAQLR
jgi:tRNA (uracil-5-)-methyltransferase